MKNKNSVVASTLLVAGLATATVAWAKPGTKSTHAPSNHGQTVSAAAHSKTDSETNHGKTVSEVARAKGTTSSTTHSTTVRAATHVRNAAIQSAERTYQLRRARILNDGNHHDELTSAQREALKDALHDRNLSIRQAQDRFRVTLRRID